MLRKTVLLVPALLVAVTGCMDTAIFDDDTVATVNGIPVCKNEFRYVMQQERSSVAGQYMAKYNADFGDGFWGKKHGAAKETPLDALKATALTELEKTRHMQSLALEFGVIDEIKPFQELKGELAGINAERARIKSENGVIYGPVQYTFDAYYRQQNNNLEYALKKALADSGNPWISEADVRARYGKTTGDQSYEESKYGLLRDLCEEKVDQLIESSPSLVETKTNRKLYDSLSL
jgi:hypothetical protein